MSAYVRLPLSRKGLLSVLKFVIRRRVNSDEESARREVKPVKTISKKTN